MSPIQYQTPPIVREVMMTTLAHLRSIDALSTLRPDQIARLETILSELFREVASVHVLSPATVELQFEPGESEGSPS
jgi:hypothetical protein